MNDSSMMYLGRDGVDRIRRLASTDPWAHLVAGEILERAEALHRAPLIERAFEPGRKVMLTVSRSLAERVHTFGIAWVLDGETRHRQRLLAELEAAAGFPDWNRKHFIDTAEMMAGVALGRNWLRAIIGKPQRKTLDAAIIRHGLMPALESLRGEVSWTRATHNWNIVCCGGAIVAAVALRSDHPEICDEVIDLASAAMRSGLSSYAPDGGWAEGPSYWEYATRYAAFAIAALEEAGLDSRGLGGSSGLAATWRFGMHLTGPSGLSFDYGDNLLVPERCPALGWLAAKSADPLSVEWQKKAPGPRHPFDLVWHGPSAAKAPDAAEPEAFFDRAGIAMLRDTGPDGLYVAIRGGSNAVNHSHLDLGSFVLEAKGQRFVSDLGRDDYALPGYFDLDRRFDYFRTGTPAHNTLVFGERDQAVSASAIRLRWRSDPGFPAVAFAVDDPDAPCPFRRAIALVSPGQIAVVDHIPARQGRFTIAADWRIHTKANVVCDGSEARLSLGEVELTMRLVAPFSASFESEPVTTPPGEADNSAFRRVLARFGAPEGGAWIAVVFSLGAAKERNPTDRLEALRRWLETGQER
ncbi:MAG: heparinase II/III family protein [Pseudaminobacter sp.]|nr:heparinase II/III family protein [Pseudaminobacter sp.]